ncbi:MAG TPA: DUF1287 domain-containing protein [Myxococcota bacterium]|nr:DUF1287 domain-containing protein [Myxococcota bacterium]
MGLSLAQAARAEAGLGERIASAALAQVGVTVVYDPAYTRLAYPGGDLPPERGVCSDVVIRALRAQRVDLQQLVHEDMRAHFSAYPQKWGLRAPDRNIDHRRVLNLQTYFRRRGLALPITRDARDYRTGDIVAYTLPGGLPHIGVVAASRAWDGARPLLIHNIGGGAQIEDVLFAYEIVGHYRWR